MFSFQSMLRSAVYQTVFFYAISLGRVVVPTTKIANNLPRTYKELHCKEKPYQLGGQRDLTVQTDILYIYYKDYQVNIILILYSRNAEEMMEMCEEDTGITLFFVNTDTAADEAEIAAKFAEDYEGHKEELNKRLEAHTENIQVQLLPYELKVFPIDCKGAFTSNTKYSI